APRRTVEALWRHCGGPVEALWRHMALWRLQLQSRCLPFAKGEYPHIISTTTAKRIDFSTSSHHFARLKPHCERFFDLFTPLLQLAAHFITAAPYRSNSSFSISAIGFAFSSASCFLTFSSNNSPLK